ncbi:carbohydrate ABC transporter substrate-binding protein, CUT1 family [Paramicrobacterium humi]|uniref:Carbohydrate ABC transporter substrate-binding protein, CUT1 family n=1 Tax=Paramicrobacterium humi TaxID=640635 RepID=A0A1H4L305_9MICO|nr:ABC transporter substrate-binding protein [Microbacterium humi]SEB65111.1 carbohydrate ABC transporter substrate-binding protein, CUT1 family [Microbacterium humi]
MAKIRVLSALLLSGALAVTASGCASQSSGASDSLTYWSMWKEGEAQQKVVAAAIADFEDETGITVNVQWQGRDNVKKVVPTLNTNKTPDLIDGSFAKLAPILAETNQAAPLTKAYDAEVDGKKVSDLIPSAYLKAGELTLEGADAPWMLPYSLTSDAVWFNAAEHPELVEKAPATWDEFIDTLDELQAKGETPIGIDGDVSGYNAYWYTTLMMRLDGPGSLKKMAADESGAAWESADALTAAKMVSQLATGDYFIDGYNASKWPAQQQAWADNKAALMFNGTWIPTETGPYAADGFEYSSFPFPQVDGGPMAQRADFVGFAVPAKAHNSENAQKLAAFFLGKTYQDDLGTEAKIIPIRQDAAVSDEMSTVKAALDNADEFYQQNDGITFPGYTEKLLWPELDKLVLGTITPEKFIDEMKAGQIDYWKQNS